MKTQNIYLTKDIERKAPELINPENYMIHYDQEGRGNVTELKVNIDKTNLLVIFNNGSILIFKLNSCYEHIEPFQELNPPMDCQINNHPLHTSISIDDHCTMMSYMSSNRKEIHLMSFNWEYKIKRIEKHSVLN